MITTYICKKCKEVWKFIPEDYGRKLKKYIKK